MDIYGNRGFSHDQRMQIACFKRRTLSNSFGSEFDVLFIETLLGICHTKILSQQSRNRKGYIKLQSV